MLRPSHITREDIAEIHEAIARRRPAQNEAEQKDQQWHLYAAAVLRENDRPPFVSVKPGRESPGIGDRVFVHSRHWLTTA